MKHSFHQKFTDQHNFIKNTYSIPTLTGIVSLVLSSFLHRAKMPQKGILLFIVPRIFIRG